MKVRKKIFISIAIVIVIALMLCFLTSCYGSEIDPLENGDLIIEGDYAYDYVEENGIKIGIRIVTLSKEGREKERLEVPAELGGLPVLRIGREASSLSTLQSHASSFRTIKLKKIILPYVVKYMWTDCFYSEVPNIKEGKWVEKIILTGDTGRIPYVGEEPQYEIYRTNDKRFLELSNIEYHFNFDESDNNGIYSGDHLNQGELLIKPEKDPMREGYEFLGWYMEPECINAWDFDTKYTGVEIVKLYAKWNQITEE